MRSPLALTAVIATTLLANAGCIPFGCGGYSGNGDTVYARGGDQLVLCANGGFTVMTSGTTIEGKLVPNSAAVDQGYEGDNGQLVFTIEDGSAANTIETVGLGSGAWTEVDEDQVSLDHADTLCQALETRAWWATN